MLVEVVAQHGRDRHLAPFAGLRRNDALDVVIAVAHINDARAEVDVFDREC
ncbi:MAG: hypothetical protein ACLQMH_17210 [Solirubrobacteraceae bacterium]